MFLKLLHFEFCASSSEKLWAFDDGDGFGDRIDMMYLVILEIGKEIVSTSQHIKQIQLETYKIKKLGMNARESEQEKLKPQEKKKENLDKIRKDILKAIANSRKNENSYVSFKGSKPLLITLLNGDSEISAEIKKYFFLDSDLKRPNPNCEVLDGLKLSQEEWVRLLVSEMGIK